jgi:molybdate transport system ATP-binding protein
MATLSADFALPLRSFELALELEVAGTVALVGPSGAGKSTVLRAIAGLARPARGRIALGGDVWLDTAAGISRPPHERGVGFVFQEYALFPHLTVHQNVAYGGKDRAQAMLDRFRISELAKAHPNELSGGERQRVALARALARNPGVLLLDEPLSALDAHTKAAVRAELLDQLRSLGLPTLLVTHDFEDAATLADTVGVLVDGSIRQIGTPQELVARPRDAFVASFTGANLLRGLARRDGDELTEIRLETGELVYSTDLAEGDVGVVVYPWDVSVGRVHAQDSARNVIRGQVGQVVQIGNRVRVGIGPLTAEITTASSEQLELERGGTAFASFKATGTRLVLFSNPSGARIDDAGDVGIGIERQVEQEDDEPSEDDVADEPSQRRC